VLRRDGTLIIGLLWGYWQEVKDAEQVVMQTKEEHEDEVSLSWGHGCTCMARLRFGVQAETAGPCVQIPYPITHLMRMSAGS
jgi:hypothetical protein